MAVYGIQLIGRCWLLAKRIGDKFCADGEKSIVMFEVVPWVACAEGDSDILEGSWRFRMFSSPQTPASKYGPVQECIQPFVG